MACLFSNCFCELDYTLSVKKPVFLRFLGVLDVIPIRSCQAYSKRICLWDLAQSICIVFIIQIVWAI